MLLNVYHEAEIVISFNVFL